MSDTPSPVRIVVLHFFFFFEQITRLALWSHQSCLWACASSAEFAIGGLSRSSLCTGCSALSLQLHRAESGSLTCLIAFDSSLSSPADQWSSVLFIRNINVPHIPTGSAANPLSPVWGWRFILYAQDHPWLWLIFYFLTVNVAGKIRKYVVLVDICHDSELSVSMYNVD